MLARCILARLAFPSARFNVLKLSPAPRHALETEAERITAFRYRFTKNTARHSPLHERAFVQFMCCDRASQSRAIGYRLLCRFKACVHLRRVYHFSR